VWSVCVCGMCVCVCGVCVWCVCVCGVCVCSLLPFPAEHHYIPSDKINATD